MKDIIKSINGDKSLKTTTSYKKTVEIGKSEYINTRTGAIEEMAVIKQQIKATDFNFHKIWLFNILKSFDAVGNKKMKVCNYILDNMNSKNQIVDSQTTIAKKLKISRKTVNETFSVLIESKFLFKFEKIYVVNSDFIFKGNPERRQHCKNILLQFENENVDE